VPSIFQNPSYISPELKNKKAVKEFSPQFHNEPTSQFHHDYIYPQPKNKTNNFNEIVNQLGLHNEKLVELMKERIEQKELTSKEQELREENENLRNENQKLLEQNNKLQNALIRINGEVYNTHMIVKEYVNHLNNEFK
jgi:flagellar motility protein MotE (MotC chaperone)